jgi:hypothetical protein
MGKHQTFQIALIFCLAFAVVGCSPTKPSAAPVLKSIQYVRTRPVTRPPTQSGVSLNSDIPILGDPQHRSRISSVTLRAVDATTFVYDYPGNFGDIPADTECSFYVSDTEVSENFVARDILVNGTRIRVETVKSGISAGNMEYGRFKVTEDGRVY